MMTVTLPTRPDAKSPAGAEIRFLVSGQGNNMTHSTVPPQQVNRATVHATVSEFWYILEGHGELWRANVGESGVSVLVPGTAIDIPSGTAFQCRNTGDTDLRFVRIAMPSWPGDSEATFVTGIWQPTV